MPSASAAKPPRSLEVVEAPTAVLMLLALPIMVGVSAGPMQTQPPGSASRETAGHGPPLASRREIGRFASMAVIPKSTHRSELPKVVQARDPKVIARERARAAGLAMPPPTLREAPIRPRNQEAATVAEIAEALTFAGDPDRPATCMMAQIAAERIILHLEKKGFVLIATDPKPAKRR